MPGLTSIMDNGLSGLFLARVALQTVSHNIANVNTPGFSRQNVLMTARLPLQMAYGAIGRGAQIDEVRRMTDAYLVEKDRNQNALLAGYTEIDSNLGEIEAIFGSVSDDHLGTSLTSFFKAWSDLATPPISGSNKQAVVNAAQAVAADFQSTASALSDLERGLNDGIEQELGDLNGLLRRVADLNRQILYVESQQAQANDLRDQRDALVLEISKLTRISALEREDGTVDVILKGRTLVTRGEAQQLELRRESSGSGGQAQVMVAGTGVAVTLDAGKLQGMVDSRDLHVADARQALDELARLLAQKVNAIHAQGRTASSREMPFFTGDSAATLSVNSVIANDPDQVAASRSGLEGDNDIALEIAALSTTPLEAGGAETLLDRYNGLIVDLASRSDSSRFLLQSQQNVVETVENRLESVRGVSLDEEGAEMVRYQNAYSAAARVVTAANDMFQTLLEMV